MTSHAAPSPSSGLRSLLEQEGRQRLILLANHVLASEPVATRRLMPHAGRVLQISAQGWPRLLEPLVPAPAPLAVEITRAGLLDLLPLETAPLRADLEVAVDTTDPLSLTTRVLTGGTPGLQLQGDAQLAADVNWLAENLKWDVAADIERFFGPVPADRLRTWGLAVLRALREAASRLSAMRPAP